MNSKIKLNILTFVDILLVFSLVFAPWVWGTNLYHLEFIARFICLSLIIYEFIYTKTSLKYILIFIFTFIITLISTRYSESTKLFDLLLLIFAFRGVNNEKFIARDFIIRSIITVLEIFLYFKSNSYTIEPFIGERIRYTLGFGHANTLGFALMIISIELMYLTRKKRSYIGFLFACLIIYLNYSFISSRTSLVVLAISLFCFILMKLKLNLLKFRPINFIFENTFLILLILSFLLVYLYHNGNEFAIYLNGLFSTRLYLSYGYIDYYGFNLFGHNLVTGEVLPNGFNATFIDMAYIYVVLKYGILATLLLIFLFNRLLHYLFINKKYYSALFIIMMLFWGTMEFGMYSWEYVSFIGILSVASLNKEKEFSLPEIKIDKNILFICIITILLMICPWNINNDSFIEHSNLILSFYNKIFKYGLNIYDYSLGLGSNIFEIASSGFLNPLNLIIYPLSKINLNYYYKALLVVKLGACSLFSYLWFSKLTENKQVSLFLSPIISFSGIMYSYLSSGYTDVYYLLPLLLYFIEKYIQDSKTLGLIITTSIIAICGTPYLIPILLYALLYALIRYFILFKQFNKKILLNYLKLFLIIILSVFVVSFIVLPSFIYSSSNYEEDNILRLLLTFLIPVREYSETNITLYSSVSCFVLFPTLFLLKDKKKMTLMILLLIISLISSILLSRIFTEAIYSIFLLSCAYVLIELIDNYSNKYSVIIIITSIILLLLSSIYLYKHSTFYTFYAIVTINYCLLFIVILIGLIINLKKQGPIVVCFAIFLELSIPFAYNFSGDYLYMYKDNNSIISKEDDYSFYRAINLETNNKNQIKSDPYYNANYAYTDYINGVSGFSINTNEYNKESSEYLDKVFSQYSSRFVGYDKNYLSLYNIAGAKYLYGKDDTTINGNYLIKVNDLTLINNENNLSFTSSLNLTNEAFNISSDLYGYITITNISNNKVLDISNESIIFNDYNTDSNTQKWLLTEVNNGYVLLSVADKSKCIDVLNNTLILNTYDSNSSSNILTLECIDEKDTSIPSYYTKDKEKDYYINNYYVELGYVNNNTISSNYLDSLDEFIQERILREYIALEDSTNKSYSLSDELNMISGPYTSTFTYDLNDSLNNRTLSVLGNLYKNINMYLYKDDELIDTSYCEQTSFCNITNTNNTDTLVVKFDEDLVGGYEMNLYSFRIDKVVEEEIYNQKINNSFTNINYSNDYISGNINISEDNSLVYTYIAYDDNWTVTVDGKQIDKIKANYGFIAFRLDSGNHNVVFEYKIPHMNTYIVLSILSLLGLVSIKVISIVLRKTNIHITNFQA